MRNRNATKSLEFAILLFLLVFAFFAGVNYSDSVKNHASWLFEPKEEEIELPDLSKEKGELGATVDETGDVESSNQYPNPSTAQQNQVAPAVKE